MMQEKNLHPNDPATGNALARLRARMSPQSLFRADRIAKINEGYVKGPNDKALDEAVDQMLDDQAAFHASTGYAKAEADRIRALFVIGESGSGKSTAIRRLFALKEQLQPYVDDYGQNVQLAYSFKAPKPTTAKLVAKTGLRTIGYPIERDDQANVMWDLFREQLKEREVLWLHVDEMQHVVKGSNHATVQDTADVVKNLLQLEDWPLNAIFSGVPGLAAFLEHEDGQLKNRCKILRFEPLRQGQDTRFVQRMVEGIIVRHAEMKPLEALLSEEFANRLLHAASGAFGTSIQITRSAIFGALRAGREEVHPEDFELAYAQSSGCRPGENVFAVANWRSINPSRALHDLVAKYQESEKEALKARSRRG
ncbi:ATP-binding protein [Aminobacter ciceronei]|uniref:ORC1/DEAH AAA+ ATPase domain-containing protein n=2 Tax=Aminobacter ciceronei TaxID=150723 RepID=A0ABR6CGX9_9HYPH|nr:ATP-binding protein [Aminobacter ciceronei]MBA8910536.1 hypothetical protein [Aminobacter ciceronei]MBA9024307.1 hypothetical protein [Aminobacter ciceronei]